MQIGDDDFCENLHFVLNGNVNELMQRYPDHTTDIDHWLGVGLMQRTAYIFPTNCARSIRLTPSNKKSSDPHVRYGAATNLSACPWGSSHHIPRMQSYERHSRNLIQRIIPAELWADA